MMEEEVRGGRTEASWREIDERCAAGDREWLHPEEEAALERLVREHADVASDPLWEQPGQPKRRTLVACLFARKLDVGRAAELLRAHVTFRERHNVPRRVWLRDVPEAAARSLSQYCFTPPGRRTRDGKSVTYIFAGRYDPSLPIRDVVLYMMWLFDHALRTETLDSWRRGACYVEDIAGAGLSTMPSRRDKAEMGEMQNVFPVLVRTILIVEPGVIVRVLLAVARLFMRDKIMKRIECVPRAVVLERVEKDQLLAHFGGTAEHDHEAFRATVLEEEARLLGAVEL